MKKIFCVLIALSLSMACASKTPKNVNVDELKENHEFDSQVKIVEDPGAAAAHPVEAASPENAPAVTPPEKAKAVPLPAPKKAKDKKGKKKTPKKSTKAATPAEAPKAEAPTRRQPELESDIGFNGRRPIKDPFRVGEKVVHSVNYFKMSAGTLSLETRSFAEVNGRKNYQFRTSIKTSNVFSSVYTVNDYVDVLMDYELMIPSVFTLHVKETSQVKEAQMLFDQTKNQATYWERKVTDKDGIENKKQQWEIYPYAQNVFSAAFYLRTFQWEVGKENAFAVADDEKNLIFRAKAIRKERLSTAVGDFDAIVIRPEFELKGKFNPTGDNYIWISDDDRKYILRIESKIKIGTLVSEVVEIRPGHP